MGILERHFQLGPELNRLLYDSIVRQATLVDFSMCETMKVFVQMLQRQLLCWGQAGERDISGTMIKVVPCLICIQNDESYISTIEDLLSKPWLISGSYIFEVTHLVNGCNSVRLASSVTVYCIKNSVNFSFYSGRVIVKICFIVVLVCTFFISPFSSAAEPGDRKIDREQLLEVFRETNAGLNSQDIDSIMNHFDQDAVVSFMTTVVGEGKEGIVAYYNKLFHEENAPLKDYQSTPSLDGPAIFHGDTVTAHGRTDDIYTLSDGSRYQFDTRWVATAVKKEGRWYVVSLNFSVDPFDNIVLKEVGDKIKVVGILSFLAGVVLVLLGLLIARKLISKSS